MAVIRTGSGTTIEETAAERNARLQAAFNKASTSTTTTAAATLARTFSPAQTASTSFVRRPVEPVAPVVPAQTASTSFVRRPVEPIVAPPQQVLTPVSVAPTSLNLARTTTEAPRITSVAPTAINVAEPLPPPQTPQVPDIDQRQYTLPQFGEQPTGFGLDGTLNRAQLAEARRLTGTSMFVYGKLPSVISIDVARGLPYNPTSKLFQDLMQESFGVPGFDTPDEWLTQLGYQEYEPGKWEILDPITITGYGEGVYQSGGTSPSSGVRYSAARGGGYSRGGSLVSWNIGF